MATDLLNQLELRHLVALRAVAEERSFGRAAERLGYTQSAVSQQIAALERMVGQPLFERPGGPRAVSITPAGEVLLSHARVILDRVRAAEADLGSYLSAQLGRLAIGTFQSVSVRVLPEVVRRLRVERPGIDVTLLESDHEEELLSGVVHGDLDLTFMVGSVPDGPYELIALACDPFVLISPASEPLAPAGEPVPVERLNGTPIVSQTMNACQVLIDGGLRRLGVEPDVLFRTADNAAVQAMVRSGLGHAVMPRLAVDSNDPGVIVADLVPPLPPRTIGIVVPTGRHRAPAVDAFVDLAREVCAEVMPGLTAETPAV